MRLLLLLFSLPAVLLAQTTRAQALAHASPDGSCLSVSVDALEVIASGQVLTRIVFVNHCDEQRTFFWCAENSGAPVPAAVACPRSQGGRGAGAELRHTIAYRKEFQWHLPRGTRIRFQDCPGQEIPTAEFGCTPPTAATTRR
jgi:hypothetical protein